MVTLTRKLNPKLSEVFNSPITNGIFNHLNSIVPFVPWAGEIDSEILDAEYFGNISGQKTISPLVKMVLKDSTTGVLTNEDISELADIIYKMNIANWNKLHDTLELQYNPISNYDMEERETSSGSDGYTKTNTGTQNITHGGTQTNAETNTNTTTHTGTQETEDTGTITTDHTGTQRTVEEVSATGSGSGSTERNIFGFNSSTSVGDSEDSTSNTTSTTSDGDSTRTDNLTDEQTNDTTTTRTDNLTDSESGTRSNTRTDDLTDGRTDNLSESNSGTHSDTRTLTRSGNIGVTSSQQMIEQERNLWLWNFIYSVVFPSVDKVLTISTY